MSMGQWLFDEAAQTGDWESAALALRAELAKATADRDALIASVEQAWTLVATAVVTNHDNGSLFEFAAEAELVR